MSPGANLTIRHARDRDRRSFPHARSAHQAIERGAKSKRLPCAILANKAAWVARVAHKNLDCSAHSHWSGPRPQNYKPGKRFLDIGSHRQNFPPEEPGGPNINSNPN